MSDEEVVNKKEVEEVSTKAAEKSGKKKKSKKDAKVRSASSASQLEMRHIKEANEENQDLKIEEEDKGSGVKKKKKSKGKSAQSGPSSPTIVIDSVGSAKGKEKEVVVDKCPVDFRRPGSTRRLSLQDTKKVMDAVALWASEEAICADPFPGVQHHNDKSLVIEDKLKLWAGEDWEYREKEREKKEKRERLGKRNSSVKGKAITPRTSKPFLGINHHEVDEKGGKDKETL